MNYLKVMRCYIWMCLVAWSFMIIGCGGDSSPVPNTTPTVNDVSDYDEPIESGTSDEGASNLTCGSILYTWEGLNVYYNGPGTESCGGSGTYGYNYQCVELVNRYLMTIWKTPRIYADAKNMLSSADPDYFSIYLNNGSVGPAKGDFIVFDRASSKRGHVALVIQTTSDKVTIIEQNCGKGYMLALNRNGNDIRREGWITKGWGHVKANTQLQQPDKPKLSGEFSYANNAVIHSGTDFLYVRNEDWSKKGERIITNGTPITVLGVDTLKGNKRIHLQYRESDGSVIDGWATNVQSWITYSYSDQYSNGSTTEIVYDANGTKIGSLDPNSKATPLYRKDSMLHVVYSTNAGINCKSGFVKYNGGFNVF